MGDSNIDKTSINSENFSSFEDPNLGMSVDPNAAPLVSALPEPAVDLTNYSATSGGTSSSDTFSCPVRLPRHLSAHDRVRFSDGHGGSRTLEVVDLIRESRNDPQALQQVRLLANLAAEQDPAVLSSCYLDREENLLPALAQLASSDPVARHEGALTLRSFILGHPEDRVLQQGLLATVSNISETDHNSEARQVVAAVYQDNSPQNEGLRNWMQSHTPAPSYVGEPQTPANGRTNSAANYVASAGGAQILDSFGRSLAETAVTATVGTAFPTLPSTPLGNFVTNQILSLIEQRTSGTPLEGVPPEGILAFAQNNAQLPAAQFDSGMYLRILASALPLNGFTGALFGPSAATAVQLAQEIRVAVNPASAAETGVQLAASVRSHTSLPAAEGVEGVSSPVPGIPAHAVVPGSSPVATQAWGDRLAASFSTAYNFFVPSLLTSLSGMQGLSYQPSALGPSPLASQAMGFGNPSSYHIEGPTTLDEDGHQGFGGHSQGQGSGQQDGQSHDQQPGQPDAYLA